MKTKDIIQKLKELDPSGELNCSTDFGDIVDLEIYFGNQRDVQEILSYHNNKFKGKYNYSQDKIVFECHSFKDMILNWPDLEIDYSDLPLNKIDKYKQVIEIRRQEVLELKKKIHNDIFICFLSKKYSSYSKEQIECYANNLLNLYPLPTEPPSLPQGTMMIQDKSGNRQEVKYWPSIMDRYQALFESALNFIDGELAVSFKDGEKKWNI